MYRWALLILAASLLASCQTGSNASPVVPGTDLSGQESVLETLPRSQSAAEAEVTGRILVEGLTLVADGPGQNGVVPTPAPLVRIIDPGDDILIAEPVLPGNTFRFAVDRDMRAVVQVELLVAEDVDGDGVTPDTLVQSVPVQLVLGRAVTLNLALRRGQPAAPGTPPGSDNAGAADPVFFPAEGEGELVFATVELADAAGAKTAFLARRPDGTVAFDATGNRYIEPGADRVFPDAEFNGWPDASQDAYVDPAATTFVHIGLVAAVDVVSRTITVRTDTRQDIVLAVDPFAAIQTLSSAGDVLGQLVLDQSLIGRRVEASGLAVGGTQHANLILVSADSK